MKLPSFVDTYRKQIINLLIILLVLSAAAFMTINFYVTGVGRESIYKAEEVPEADAVLILGAYVFPDGKLSFMLQDRITTGYDLYMSHKAPKIIVSGDHGRKDYDEVNTMKNVLKDKGITGKDIFMDHAGFSTYESIYRARDIFKVRKVIIVTQGYHLGRAVFIARTMGLQAYGVASDLHNYGPVMVQYQLREMAARNKDFWLSKLLKPQPTFLGDPIPVFGDGGATDDK
jgi:vancomycin permeability regulator SanA